MRSAISSLTATALVLTGGAGLSVAELNYDQLVSFVMFENEDAYRDPTGYFCKFIALSDKDDYCKAGMTYLDPKLCRIEVTREFRATYKADGVTGREFMKSRDVFALSSLDLTKVREPEIDDVRKTSRQTFEAGIDVHRKEVQQYSLLLDDKGAYRACRVNGEEKAIAQDACEKDGVQPPVSSKTMSLLFNSTNYNRAMTALRWLQNNYCASPGDPL
jgi:hypothetical protein